MSFRVDYILPDAPPKCILGSIEPRDFVRRGLNAKPEWMGRPVVRIRLDPAITSFAIAVVLTLSATVLLPLQDAVARRVAALLLAALAYTSIFSVSRRNLSRLMNSDRANLARSRSPPGAVVMVHRGDAKLGQRAELGPVSG